MKTAETVCVLVAAALIGVLATTCTWAVEPAVKFDGKNLIFLGKEGIPSADISGLVFDLGGVPVDKRFVVGKVLGGRFHDPTRSVSNDPIYVLFTKWQEEGKFEAYYWPVSGKCPACVPFLDCTVINNNQYRCVRRGAPPIGVKLRFDFGKDSLCVVSDTGWSADLEKVCEIPIP